MASRILDFLVQSVLVALMAYPCPAMAEQADAAPAEINLLGIASLPGDLVGTAGYASRYVTRGFDLDRGRATPQLSFEYDHPDGYYGGFSVTRTDYFGTKAEIDFSSGYRWTAGDFTYDAGFYYYLYPGAPRALHLSYFELGLKVAYDSGRISPFFEAYASNDYFFGTGKSLFVNGGPDIKLPWNLLGSLRAGHLIVEDVAKLLYPEYTVWSASLSKDLIGVNWSAPFSGTSIRFDQCLYRSDCGNKVYFQAVKLF